MTDIRQLYGKVRDTACQCAVVIEKLRVYNLDAGMRQYQAFVSGLQEVVRILSQEGDSLSERGISVSTGYLAEMMKGLLDAQEQKDYVLLADLLELQIHFFLEELLEQIRQSGAEGLLADYFEVNANALALRQPDLAKKLRDYQGPQDGNYSVEATTSGFATCRVAQGAGGLYMHSNKDPFAEARAWAGEMTDEEAVSYHVLGCGLGYHSLALYEELRGSYPVHVYEADIAVLWLAMHYCNMAEALRGNLHLHWDAAWRELPEALGQTGHKLCIHYPSLRLIADERIRWVFERYFVQDSSYRNAKILLLGNFNANMELMRQKPEQFRPADELDGRFRGKTVYLIAAGPSLDKNVALLAESRLRESGIIIACGTVFRKLLGMHIRPDYVMVTDANQRVLSQIYSVEQAGVPMLMLSTANRGFAEKYTAIHYMMFQEGYPRAEHEAGERGYMLFQTGGSVMTTALDAVIRLGAKRAVFVGLDLAFTDNLAHAKGTSNRVATDTGDLVEVQAWDGGRVFADQKFMIYRSWMENRLKEEDAARIEVINATEGGSYINGMRHMPLAEAIAMK